MRLEMCRQCQRGVLTAAITAAATPASAALPASWRPAWTTTCLREALRADSEHHRVSTRGCLRGIKKCVETGKPSQNAHQGVRATDRTFAAGVGLSTWEQPALGTCMVCIVLSCSAQIHAGSYRLLSGEINPAIPARTLQRSP